MKKIFILSIFLGGIFFSAAPTMASLEVCQEKRDNLQKELDNVQKLLEGIRKVQVVSEKFAPLKTKIKKLIRITNQRIQDKAPDKAQKLKEELYDRKKVYATEITMDDKELLEKVEETIANLTALGRNRNKDPYDEMRENAFANVKKQFSGNDNNFIDPNSPEVEKMFQSYIKHLEEKEAQQTAAEEARIKAEEAQKKAAEEAQKKAAEEAQKKALYAGARKKALEDLGKDNPVVFEGFSKKDDPMAKGKIFWSDQN